MKYTKPEVTVLHYAPSVLAASANIGFTDKQGDNSLEVLSKESNGFMPLNEDEE